VSQPPIFISYSRQDAEFALQLGRDLREAGVHLWIDQLDIPPGGRWETLDSLTRGRVLLLEVPDPGRQAAALLGRIGELHRLGGGDWCDFAILARTRAVLEPIRALCEASGIPVAWRDELPPLHRVREVAAFLDRLKGLGQEPLTASQLLDLVPRRSGLDPAQDGTGSTAAVDSKGPARPGAARNPWHALVGDLIRAWGDEAGAAAVPAAQILEHAYETLADQRRERSLGDGVLLATLHGAKGLEFPHVLIADGGWRADQWGENERRLLYVGMTRARETLTLGCLSGGSTPWRDEIDGDWLLRLQPECEAPPPAVMARRYRLLTPADLDLGFAGRLPPEHPIHARLSALQTGDRLEPETRDQRVLLRDGAGLALARLSKRASAEWLPRLPRVETITVIALIRRRLEDGDPAYREHCRSNTWEVPLVEIRTLG